MRGQTALALSVTALALLSACGTRLPLLHWSDTRDLGTHVVGLEAQAYEHLSIGERYTGSGKGALPIPVLNDAEPGYTVTLTLANHPPLVIDRPADSAPGPLELREIVSSTVVLSCARGDHIGVVIGDHEAVYALLEAGPLIPVNDAHVDLNARTIVPEVPVEQLVTTFLTTQPERHDSNPAIWEAVAASPAPDRWDDVVLAAWPSSDRLNDYVSARATATPAPAAALLSAFDEKALGLWSGGDAWPANIVRTWITGRLQSESKAAGTIAEPTHTRWIETARAVIGAREPSAHPELRMVDDMNLRGDPYPEPMEIRGASDNNMHHTSSADLHLAYEILLSLGADEDRAWLREHVLASWPLWGWPVVDSALIRLIQANPADQGLRRDVVDRAKRASQTWPETRRLADVVATYGDAEAVEMAQGMRKGGEE